MNPTTVASHRSDFCRYVASIDHWEWRGLMLTTGTLATQHYMICTLQEKKEKREGKKQQTLQSTSRLCFSPADLIHRIKTELCEFRINKSFTCVYRTSFHVASSLLPLCCPPPVGVWQEEDVVNWTRCHPTFYPLGLKMKTSSLILEADQSCSICNSLFQPGSAHQVFIL